MGLGWTKARLIGGAPGLAQAWKAPGQFVSIPGVVACWGSESFRAWRRPRCSDGAVTGQ